MPSHDTKPWEIKALDTKELWNFGSYKGLSSLHLICGVLGLDTPKDGKVDGSNIHKSYYNDNNKGEIKDVSKPTTNFTRKDLRSLASRSKETKTPNASKLTWIAKICRGRSTRTG